MISGVDLTNNWCFAIEAGSFLGWNSIGAVNGSCHDNESGIDARTLIRSKCDDAKYHVDVAQKKGFQTRQQNKWQAAPVVSWAFSWWLMGPSSCGRKCGIWATELAYSQKWTVVERKCWWGGGDYFALLLMMLSIWPKSWFEMDLSRLLCGLNLAVWSSQPTHSLFFVFFSSFDSSSKHRSMA